MTLDCGTSFLYVVNVRNECDFLCYSQIFAGILEYNTMMEKLKNLRLQPLSRFLCVFQTD